MIIPITFKYTEKNVISPRARKPRDIMHDDGEADVMVPELSEDEAPVVLVVPESITPYSKGELAYRYYDGQLLLPREDVLDWDDEKWLRSSLKDLIGWGHHTKDEVAGIIDRFEHAMVFIGDQVFTTAPEPFFSVCVWAGRGKASVFVELVTERRGTARTSAGRYFNVAQGLEAEAYAKELATTGRDFPLDIASYELPTVTGDPSIFTANPQAEADRVAKEAAVVRITSTIRSMNNEADRLVQSDLALLSESDRDEIGSIQHALGKLADHMEELKNA
jgi:hypothetical protein